MIRALAFAGLALLASACRQDMHDQPRFEPLESSAFFADGRSARPRVPDTLARGELDLDEHMVLGKSEGKPALTFPFAVTEKVLERGRERYGIFCAPCHDAVGDGLGMVVQRGMKQPPSLHVERLRQAPPGYLYDVITNGFGTMVDYADRVSVRDRWAIVAYVRALQLSQRATIEDVPERERAPLMEAR